MIVDVFTKALIFRPKKLKDGWEHKNGFFVSHDTKTALNVINESKDFYKQKTSNEYFGLNYDALRSRANDLLYKIESSNNNYFEFLWWISILICGATLIKLVPQLWSYPNASDVRLLIFIIIYLPALGFLFWRKKVLDKSRINEFMKIEDALKQTNNN